MTGTIGWFGDSISCVDATGVLAQVSSATGWVAVSADLGHFSANPVAVFEDQP
jgi:hypothetical protein